MQSTKSAARDRWPPYIGTPQVHTSAHSCTQFGGKETTTGTRMLKAHHLRTYDDALKDLPRLEALSQERCFEPKTSGRVSLKGVIPSFVTDRSPTTTPYMIAAEMQLLIRATLITPIP